MDQNVILVETVPLEFDLESLGCRLRIRPGQTKFMDRLSRLAEEAARVARPKAVARLCGLTILDEEKVQVGEVTFSSPLLRQKMDGLGRAFPYLASEGTELADWSLSLSSSLEQVFASALREVAVQQAENLLERTLLERYRYCSGFSYESRFAGRYGLLRSRCFCLNCWPHCPRNWV